jgi:internalin A
MEAEMKHVLQKMILWSTVLILGLDIAYALPPDNTSARRVSISKEESEAAASLTKLGVPLQRDPRGIVRWIEATKKEFADDAMQYLPALSGLEWLEIGGGKVSPAGTEYLKNCRSLRRLYIHDIDLSGDELAWLSGLTKLEALSLQHTGINGKALKNLAAFDTLAVLNLSGNDIADGDIGPVAQMKRLEVLALADTKITGAGIAKLEGMSSLNELNLMNCHIQDGDLEYFLSMRNLRIVYAKDCNLSDMAVQNIVMRFPMLAIFRN